MKHTYHVVWFEREEDHMSTGRNFEAKTPQEALNQWESEYPGTFFFAIYIKQ